MWNLKTGTALYLAAEARRGDDRSMRVRKILAPFYLQNDTGMKRKGFLLKAPQDFAKVWGREFGVGE